jgi:hypothetical protein
MKTNFIILLGLIWFSFIVKAGEKILPYSAFGPQVLAHELIGKAWWQWQPVGGDDDREYPIKVVVYWNQSVDDIAKRYPVVESKEQDYRYVPYLAAVKHMEDLIQDFKKANVQTTVFEKHLADLKMEYQNEQSASCNPLPAAEFR